MRTYKQVNKHLPSLVSHTYLTCVSLLDTISNVLYSAIHTQLHVSEWLVCVRACECYVRTFFTVFGWLSWIFSVSITQHSTKQQVDDVSTRNDTSGSSDWSYGVVRIFQNRTRSTSVIKSPATTESETTHLSSYLFEYIHIYTFM